jgi:hypothetical protein
MGTVGSRLSLPCSGVKCVIAWRAEAGLRRLFAVLGLLAAFFLSFFLSFFLGGVVV